MAKKRQLQKLETPQKPRKAEDRDILKVEDGSTKSELKPMPFSSPELPRKESDEICAIVAVSNIALV